VSVIVVGAGAGSGPAEAAIRRAVQGNRLTAALARVVAQRIGRRWVVFLCDSSDADLHDPGLRDRILLALERVS
jgi:hypothetical protein